MTCQQLQLLVASTLHLLMLAEPLHLLAFAADGQTLASTVVTAGVAGVAATAAAGVRRQARSPHTPPEDGPGLLGTAVACTQAHHATTAAAFAAHYMHLPVPAAAALLQACVAAALLLWLHF
jgi:hypothetical protein